MAVNPLDTRSRCFLPALARVFAACAAAVLLCCVLPASPHAQNETEDAPALDWSRDTIALNTDGSPTAKGRQYAVQVAVMRDDGSARQIAADLASRGHDPYILTMADDDGALWHTVRLDIHDSLVDALRSAREFYGDEGVPPSIVQLGSLRGLPLEEARFVVQVAAFESEENALRHAASLRSQGLDAGTMLREDSEGQVWRIVHIGVFDTFVDAADRARRYTEETDCECFVVVVAEDLLNESVLPLPEPDAAPPLEEAAPSPVFDAAHNASAESPNAKSATAPNE